MKNPITNKKPFAVENKNTCPYSGKSHVPINSEDPLFHVNPELTFPELRNKAPIQKITLDDKFPIWLVSKFDDAVNVLRDPRFIKSPNNLRTINLQKEKQKKRHLHIYFEDFICLPMTLQNTHAYEVLPKKHLLQKSQQECGLEFNRLLMN